MNARTRRKLRRETTVGPRAVSEYDRLSRYERQSITLQSGRGLENRHRVMGKGFIKCVDHTRTMAPDGTTIVKQVFRISKDTTRMDRTSCIYRQGPTGRYPNG